MTFKDYFNSLSTGASNDIRDEMLKTSGMSYPSFYDKLRNDKWKPLEISELERICKQEFDKK